MDGINSPCWHHLMMITGWGILDGDSLNWQNGESSATWLSWSGALGDKYTTHPTEDIFIIHNSGSKPWNTINFNIFQ